MKDKGYRLDINGLRAYAVMAVLLFHFEILGFGAGFLGVDIFFVISGFLMTGIITRGIEKQNFKLFDFYMARIRRIMPVLVVLIATLLGLGWFWLPTPDYQALGGQSRNALAFVSNIFYWLSAGYFDADAHEKWLLHTWTLGVEFQFYILLPLFLLIISKIKYGMRALLYSLIGAFVISLGLSIYLSHKMPTAAFYLLPTRGWEFVAGGLVYLSSKEFPKLQRFSKVYFIVGVVLIAFSMYYISSKLAWPSAWALLPVLGTALIILAKQEQSILTVNPVAQWLGDRSYSIYIWHWPVVVSLYYFGIQDNPRWIGFGILLSLFLGHLSYHLVEIPTRKYLSKITIVKQLATIASLAIVVGLATISVKIMSFDNRLPKAVEIAANEQTNKDPRYDKCQADHNKTGSPSCIYGKDKVAAILMGDSHALATVTALGKAAELYNKGIISWAMHSCPTLDNIKYTEVPKLPTNSCNLLNKWADKQLTKYPKIPLVLVSRTSSYVMGPNEPERKIEAQSPVIYFTKKYENISDSNFKAEFSKVLIDTTCRLAKDRTVYLMRPVPEFGTEIPKQISRQLLFKGSTPDRKIPIAQYYERNKLVWHAQDEAAKKCGVKILNPLPYLCDNQYCYGSKNDHPLYQDDDHLSEYGNKLLVPMFEQVFVK